MTMMMSGPEAVSFTGVNPDGYVSIPEQAVDSRPLTPSTNSFNDPDYRFHEGGLNRIELGILRDLIAAEKALVQAEATSVSPSKFDTLDKSTIKNKYYDIEAAIRGLILSVDEILEPSNLIVPIAVAAKRIPLVLPKQPAHKLLNVTSSYSTQRHIPLVLPKKTPTETAIDRIKIIQADIHDSNKALPITENIAEVISLFKHATESVKERIIRTYIVLEDRGSKRDFEVKFSKEPYELDIARLKRAAAIVLVTSTAISGLGIGNGHSSKQNSISSNITQSVFGPNHNKSNTHTVVPILSLASKETTDISPAQLAAQQHPGTENKPVTGADRVHLIEQGRIYAKALMYDALKHASEQSHEINKQSQQVNHDVITRVGSFVQNAINAYLQNSAIKLTPQLVASASQELANVQTAVHLPNSIGQSAPANDSAVAAVSEKLFSGNNTYNVQEQAAVSGAVLTAAKALMSDADFQAYLSTLQDIQAQPLPSISTAPEVLTTTKQQAEPLGVSETTLIDDQNLEPAKKEFLKTAVAAAKNLQSQGIKVNFEVLTAQAINESDWGQSKLATQGHNYFGIKAGTEWQGATIAMPTKEHLDGQDVVVMAQFKQYDSLQASFEDYAAFILSKPWFQDAARNFQDPSLYLDGLLNALDDNNDILIHQGDSGAYSYATDPDYKAKTLAIISQRQLDTLLSTSSKPEVAKVRSSKAELQSAIDQLMALPSPEGMLAGADKVVATAVQEARQNYVESPIFCDAGNSSAVGSCGAGIDKYTKGDSTDSHLEYWCMDAAGWAREHGGLPVTSQTADGRTPGVSAARHNFKNGKDGTFVSDITAGLPGDLIFFPEHVGIVLGRVGNNYITWQGNTSMVGYENNGVTEAIKAVPITNYIVGFGHTPDPTPSIAVTN